VMTGWEHCRSFVVNCNRMGTLVFLYELEGYPDVHGVLTSLDIDKKEVDCNQFILSPY